MAKEQSPQERIAAARLLYAILKDYLDRPTWTPIEGALILSGMHAPAGCTEFPREGTGLDGKPFKGDVVDRWIKAREIMRLSLPADRSNHGMAECIKVVQRF